MQPKKIQALLLLFFALFVFQASLAFKAAGNGTSTITVTGDVGTADVDTKGSSRDYTVRVSTAQIGAKGGSAVYSVFLGWLPVGLSAQPAWQQLSSGPSLVSSITSPISTTEGDKLYFTATVLNNISGQQVVAVVPSVSIEPAGKAVGLKVTPSNISALSPGALANFTVNFSYPAAGKVEAVFSASAVSQSSGAQITSNAVSTSIYFGVQFALSMSTGKLEILPNGGTSIPILARNTASFTREKVRLKLSDTSCCSFSLTPNGVDIPAGAGTTFTLTLSPVSTARPGTTYTTNIVAYTDTEPDLASADLVVSILRDIVPETGAAREKALAAIKNANDTIVFVDIRIADAEKQKLDTYKAATTLAEARKLYNSAIELLEQGDYDGAYAKATDALTKAQSALILVPTARPAPGVAMTKDAADAAIKTADETILFVDKQVADAEQQKLDTYEAATKLAEARGLIKQAKAALESGDYASAADLAAQATTLATSALQSIPKPGQLPVAKLATIAGAVLLIGAIIYFKFIRKQPPQQQTRYYSQPPQQQYYRPQQQPPNSPIR